MKCVDKYMHVGMCVCTYATVRYSSQGKRRLEFVLCVILHFHVVAVFRSLVMLRISSVSKYYHHRICIYE